jgi:predicted ABC-type ATPase
MPNLYIIAGCNGAGKTTASFTILPEILNCKEFVNADEIARGISPFQPESAAIEAGRVMLKRIRDLIELRADFAFETTLSTRSFVVIINEARKMGYQVKMVFVWIKSVELAIERVALRVSEGGHNIPSDIIQRRYYRGIKNFFALYMSICDSWMIVDNSMDRTRLIAEGEKDYEKTIHNAELWNQILKLRDEKGN